MNKSDSNSNELSSGSSYKLAYREIENLSIKSFKKHANLFLKNSETIQLGKVVKEQETCNLSCKGITCQKKRLIFAAINAGIFYAKDTFEERRRRIVINNLHHVFVFWTFIKSLPLTDSQSNQAIKLFETWRVDTQSLKIQSTGAATIINLITIALEFKDFRRSLKAVEFNYLENLSHTRLAKHDERSPITLNHWFSQHTWLRRDDVGIGEQLYNRLSSPQALMASFRVSIVTLLTHIQKCKTTIVKFFMLSGIDESDFGKLQSLEMFDTPNLHSQHVQNVTRDFFDKLKQQVSFVEDQEIELLEAIELIVYSNCYTKEKEKCLNSILSNSEWHKKQIFFTSTTQAHPIFSIGFLKKLAKYASSTPSSRKAFPVCEGETMLFAWLMAFQTVQVSDISKLKLSNFSFLKRQNGKISFIECDYFKGRANTFHRVKSLNVNTELGSSILRYLEDKSYLKDMEELLVPSLRTAYLTGRLSITSRLLFALDEVKLKSRFDKNLAQEKVTSVFFTAYKTLMLNGKRNLSSYNDDFTIQKTTFGHSAIKTSAIYASTETFDPSSLINANSHTNETEKTSYRDERNFEWDNLCGRVTRAVMRDLYVNVFRLSQKNETMFLSEFTRAREYVFNKSREVYATLKVVTDREGSVNEIGLSNNQKIEDGDFPDTVYLIDCAQTVMKMLHYLEEVKRKHKVLKATDTQYFFMTVLPTTEWIELLFNQNKFSAKSLSDGAKMYRRFKDDLPPHFNHKLI